MSALRTLLWALLLGPYPAAFFLGAWLPHQAPADLQEEGMWQPLDAPRFSV